LPGASEYHDGQVNVLSWIGQVAFSCHKKLGIFKFMCSLPDKFFIVHVLDLNFVFCGLKLDLRQYNIAIYRAVGERVDMLSPLYPLPRYPSGHCLMGSEFYSGQLIFMSNFP
jgi:hypothetical protein